MAIDGIHHMKRSKCTPFRPQFYLNEFHFGPFGFDLAFSVRVHLVGTISFEDSIRFASNLEHHNIIYKF